MGSTSIPTGDIVPVRGSPFDFLTAHPVGKHIDEVEGALERPQHATDLKGRLSAM